MTLDTLDRLLAGAPDGEGFAGFREGLAAAVPEAPDLAPTATALTHAQARVRLWTLSETGWDAVADGLRRTYRTARRRRSAKGDEALHVWRKPVKYHLYHLRLLSGIHPDEMAERARAADELGEHLGLHQDLAVLAARVAEAGLPKASRRALGRLIGEAKAEAETQARALAPGVLGDPPKALVTRWGKCWEVWRG